MKSLAEHLGVVDPQRPEEPAVDVSEHVSIQEFCRGVLRSREYRESILRRVRLDTLPSAIETLLYHYAEGSPKSHVAVSGEVAITKVVREIVHACADDDDASQSGIVH